MRTAFAIISLTLSSSFSHTAPVFAVTHETYMVTPQSLLEHLPEQARNRYKGYPSLKAPEQTKWMKNYQKAITLAKSERKDVFILFCKDVSKKCKKLTEKEFYTDDFKKFLSQFICLEVNDKNIFSLYYVQQYGSVVIIDYDLHVLLSVPILSRLAFSKMEFWNQPIYDKLPPTLEKKKNPWCVRKVKRMIPLGTDKEEVMQILKPFKISKRFINEGGIVYCIFKDSGKKYIVPRSYRTGKQICATSGWTFKPITVRHEMIVCWLPGIVCGGATYIYFDKNDKVEDVFQGGT